MNWETFQSVCQDKLDLLIRFSYGKEAFRRQQTTEIQSLQTRRGFNISKTVGVDSGMLRSIDSFVDKVVKEVSALESKSVEETRRSHIELFFHFQ